MKTLAFMIVSIAAIAAQNEGLQWAEQEKAQIMVEMRDAQHMVTLLEEDVKLLKGNPKEWSRLEAKLKDLGWWKTRLDVLTTFVSSGGTD